MNQEEETLMPSNPMQQLKIEKVVVNISVGRSGDPLLKATNLLEQLTGQKPCTRKAKRTIRDWGIRKGEPIACLVTLRGETAKTFLTRVLDAVGNRLSKSAFDSNGNFSFGIREHIEISDVDYDPDIGIFGMNVSIVMEKRGYRVKKRRRLMAKIGRLQRVTRSEVMDYFSKVYSVRIE